MAVFLTNRRCQPNRNRTREFLLPFVPASFTRERFRGERGTAFTGGMAPAVSATHMVPIAEARFLAPEVKLFRLFAPQIARKRKAGQFVIVRVHERGERIPLTIADGDIDQGIITVVVQGVGKTTRLMNRLEAGDTLCDVVGPLGKPSEVESVGTAVVIGGGLGAAIAYPTAKAFREAGNRVISILGGRSRGYVILEDEVRAISNETHVTTDDGSHGRRGMVTEVLSELIAGGRKLDLVLAIGPIPMMRAVAERTRAAGIRTVVSLNPIMVDGTGMCGGCRVIVGGKPRFACVDGPEFDGHAVDFGILMQRNAMYREREREALRRYESEMEGEEVVAGREVKPETATCSSGEDCRFVLRFPALAGVWKGAAEVG